MLGVMVSKQLMAGHEDGPSLFTTKMGLRVRAYDILLPDGRVHEVRWKASNGAQWTCLEVSGHDHDVVIRKALNVTTLVHYWNPDTMELMRAATAVCNEHGEPIIAGIEHPIFIDCCRECLRIAGLVPGSCSSCGKNPRMFHINHHPEFRE